MANIYRPFPGDITRVHGIRVGQAQNAQAMTGVTVVLPQAEGAVGGVSVRGAAPGTRETDLLRPGNLVERAHAVVLSGGSANFFNSFLVLGGGLLKYVGCTAVAAGKLKIHYNFLLKPHKNQNLFYLKNLYKQELHFLGKQENINHIVYIFLQSILV